MLKIKVTTKEGRKRMDLIYKASKEVDKWTALKKVEAYGTRRLEAEKELKNGNY